MTKTDGQARPAEYVHRQKLVPAGDADFTGLIDREGLLVAEQKSSPSRRTDDYGT
ncbi:MAG: hypothetical protein PHC30_08100 [Lentisphaeria bacterium]|nr:hypothetical protein [Lentisphaeria bacterium]